MQKPDTLHEMLLKVERSGSGYTGVTTNWHRNPEGPQAVDRITDLTRKLEIARDGLEVIANDPYPHGQRIQKMKRTAAQTLAQIEAKEN